MSQHLTLCPACHTLRNSARPCVTCQRQQRARRGLALACAILGLIILALVLSSCSGTGGDVGGVQPPPRRTLSDIRAEALGQPQGAPTPALAAPTPALAAPVPTLIIPAALPPDEVSWAEWALSLGYRWCAVGEDGQRVLMGAPDGPRPIEPALEYICRD